MTRNLKSKKSKDSNRKKHPFAKFVVFILVVCIGVFTIKASSVFHDFTNNLDKIQRTEIALDDVSLKMNPGIRERHNHQDIINIAVFGIDRRPDEEKSRSDTIMIVSIDSTHQALKITSILRDTYVGIPDEFFAKINKAYYLGGAQKAIETINTNFDMNIQHFVTIDFYALVDIIDALDGITIDVRESEVKECNRILKKTDRMLGGEPSEEVTAGKQVLTGKQSLAYARMRYLGNSDFDRTARQRLVFKTMLKKLKDQMSIPLILRLSDSLSDNITTSMTNKDILRYAFKTLKVIDNMHSFSLVNDEHILGADIDGEMSLLPNSLKDLTIDLHRYIYEETYTPTDELIKRSEALHRETQFANTYPLDTGTNVKE